MALYLSDADDDYSDNEVFVGPVTLDECKKRLNSMARSDHRQTVGYVTATNSEEDCDESLIIIETRSTPNLLCKTPEPKETKTSSIPSLQDSSLEFVANNTFKETEMMVTDLCANVREIAELINEKSPKNKTESEKVEIKIHEPEREIQNDNNKSPKQQDFTQHKDFNLSPTCNVSTSFRTPVKQPDPDVYSTPSEGKITPMFKTPGIPISTKKTPTKKSFQHVVSPVAMYIKQSPIAPLIRNVHPTKKISGPSFIPKPVQSVPKTTQTNKENIVLPSLAYKAAKETKVIDISNEDKLPKSIISSIPRAVVTKHEYRHGTAVRTPLSGQDSFGELSLHQADLSICTQKSAIKKK